jgi:hypothetical protein
MAAIAGGSQSRTRADSLTFGSAGEWPAWLDGLTDVVPH